jgi:hypothetical protein
LLAYVNELCGDGAASAPQLYHLDFYAWLKDPSAAGCTGSVRPEINEGDASTKTTVTLAVSSSFSHQQHSVGTQDAPPNAASTEGFAGDSQELDRCAAQNTTLDGKERKLKRISLRLPPPPPHSSEHLPRAVRQAFRKLFESLHLQSPLPAEADAPRFMPQVTPPP